MFSLSLGHINLTKLVNLLTSALFFQSFFTSSYTWSSSLTTLRRPSLKQDGDSQATEQCIYTAPWHCAAHDWSRSLLVLADLPAAFDCIHLDTLLRRLDSCTLSVMRAMPYTCLRSYVTNRSQFVWVVGGTSTAKPCESSHTTLRSGPTDCWSHCMFPRPLISNLSFHTSPRVCGWYAIICFVAHCCYLNF